MVRYPIFLKDTDGYMYEISNEDELKSELEYNDIVDNEYDAWDANGIALELYLDKKEIKTRRASNEPMLSELRKAILHYAVVGRPKNSFVAASPDEDVINLFHAVQRHIENK